MKTYDRAYFNRWYRSRSRVHQTAAVARKVAVALASAEYLLGRRVRDVLDVGCGEAPWRAILRRMRPGIRYQGVDASEYVVRRFGRTRDIRLARFGELERLELKGPFDLIACSDVLHYVPTRELRRGLAAISKLLFGVAWIEVFTSADPITGDTREFHRRSPIVYRRLFREAGLTHCGNYIFAGEQIANTLTTFERGGQP
ncbi:MAG: class I SAM-dependent methyltransferase [Candidatus Eisenbacteria bacterium]|nr:class I SAM-dependent methyltransferase [Candidatus Eisenbacteria bacterium]